MNRYSFEPIDDPRVGGPSRDETFRRRVWEVVRGFAIFDGYEGHGLPIALAVDAATAELIVNGLNTK